MLLLIWGIIVLVGGWIVVFVIVLNSIFQSRNNRDDVLSQILYYIQTLYVEEVDARRLADVAIRAMTDKLDIHSMMLEATQAQASVERAQGSSEAIGISYFFANDTVVVFRVAIGSAPRNAGILPGDRIMNINDIVVSGVNKNRREINELLRGQIGTPVDIKVERQGTPDLINFHFVRERTPILSVPAVYMVTDDIGYIRISTFSATTPADFRVALNELRAQGMEHLILDLINNRGGNEDAVLAVASQFLDRDKTIVYRKGRNRQTVHSSQSGGEMLTGRVVVLVNGRTASGSEILAGALQDWDRAVIVGQPTIGKGTGQRQASFPDGRIFQLTASRYYTPSGRSIEPVEQGADTLQFFTLRNSREVFSGGITLDYRVFNPAYLTPFFRSLTDNNVFTLTARNAVSDNATVLFYNYPDVETFRNNFYFSNHLMNSVQQTAEASGIEWNEAEIQQSRQHIERNVKSQMAQNLFGSSALFQIRNEGSSFFQAGLRIISDPELYENLLFGIETNSVAE